MEQPAVQDCYPSDVNNCYGWGRLNAHGHPIRTRWDGDETITTFLPQPLHTAVPG